MTMTPDSLPDDAGALKALVIAAGVENERLIAIIKELQRHRFGPRSEKIDPDQLALMLEDVTHQLEVLVVALDGEDLAQHAFQPARRPLFGRDVELKEAIVGSRLHVGEGWNLDRVTKATEVAGLIRGNRAFCRDGHNSCSSQRWKREMRKRRRGRQ